MTFVFATQRPSIRGTPKRSNLQDTNLTLPPLSPPPTQAKRRVRIRAEKLVDHRFTRLLFSKKAPLHDTMMLGE